MRKKRSFSKRGILIILSLAMLTIVSCLVYLFVFKEKQITVKNISIELGNEVSSNVKDYISEELDDYKKYNLDISKVPLEGKKTKEVGEYNYIVKDKKNKFEGKIIIKDTTKPEIILKEVTIYQDSELKIEDFIESCTDLSECNYSYENEELVNSNITTPGEYEIKIIAKDNYNNENVASTKLIVKEKQKVSNYTVKESGDNSGSGKGIAVLNYHFTINKDEVSLCEPSSICMDENLFDAHMAYIKNNGFHTATLQELEDYIDGKITLPDKTVVITIDDGWFVARAITILEKYNLQATLFLIGSLASPSDYASKNLEIHSHGWDLHTPGVCSTGRGGGVLCLERSKLLEDLRKSRESLNNTKYFCYPFYEYNDYSISALQEAGFTMAFTGGWSKAKVGINKFKVPRYPINSDVSVSKLANIIN